ncbi:hypothetical protein L596_022806 [Steinernema carpocapsae]|uniref:Serpin domain-containing protein n=1 Tax=Steinernema carpocapsae TaxID=34508 RepID=A0A4U5MNF7_STECR|nr:hypothetical protein L596_022806 [Steinernema carpocapsae]
MQTSALLLSAACLLLLGSISCDYSKESFSDDLFDFAVRALRNKRESIVFSPLSAALALTAIGQNTHGDAKVEIEKLFRKEKLEIVWNRIVKTLITLREKGHIESKLVSRVYFDKSIKVKREFVSSLGNSTEATRTALQVYLC